MHGLARYRAGRVLVGESERRWKRKCSATSKRTGKQCGLWAIPGCPTCKWHGSGTQAARAKGARTMQLQLANDTVARLGGRRHVSPQTAMIEMVEEAAFNAEYWRGKIVTELAPTAGAGMIEIPDPFGDADDSSDPPVQRVWAEGLFGPNHLGDLVPHPFLAAYDRERERVVRFSRAAVAAGVEVAMVRLRTHEATVLFAATRDVLEAHGIEVSAPEVGRQIAARLRAAQDVVVDVDSFEEETDG